MLVNCAAYQHGKKLADISLAEIRQYRTRPDCFVWVALKDVEPGELDPDQIHTPGIFVHRIFQGADYEKRIEQRTVRMRM